MIIATLPDLETINIAAFLPRDIWPYMALMIAGFVVGLGGHLLQMKPMILIGVLMIFVATVVFPIAINIAHDTPPEVRDLATRSR